MKTILSAKQWSRIRAHVNGLDQKGREDLQHRLLHWREAVAKELAEVSDGRTPSAVRGKSQPLSDDMLEQILGWLRK